MKFLIIDNEDGEVWQVERHDDFPQNVLRDIDAGYISIIRFENGQFQTAAVHAQDDSRSISWGPLEEK